MMLKPARLLLALIAVAAAPAFAQNVATVNGKAIPASREDQLVKQVVAQGQQPDSPQLRDAVKKKLIGDEVLRQEAEKEGYGKKPEVQAAMENARQSIIINAMLADYVKKNPVSDAEIQAEYDKYKAAVGPTEYHAHHILVGTEQEAKDIIAKLKGGAKFEDFAKQSKDTGSAANGGDLGWMTPGKLVKPFADAMVALKNGEITQTPVKTDYGYHVIQLNESRPTQLPPLAEVKGQIAEGLQQRKIVAYREELLKKAKIQ